MTVAPPNAVKKCQSSRLRHFSTSNLTLFARVAFAAAFFGLEVVGIAWGQRAPDHVLGFQMFSETSYLTIHLFREVTQNQQRVLVPVLNGRWQAPDRRGRLRDYVWQDRVRYDPLNTLETRMYARYGLGAQLFRLQAALQDMAHHIPEDTVTLALVAKVDTLHNARPGPQQELRATKP